MNAPLRQASAADRPSGRGPAIERDVDLVSQNAPWSDMLDLIDRSAPHGFLIYFRNDVHPVMALAGDGPDCIAYLMATTSLQSACSGTTRER